PAHPSFPTRRSSDLFLPAGAREVGALEPIEIDVEHRHAPTAMLALDDERRARDLGGVDAKARGDPSRKHGLSRAELSPEREDIVRAGGPAETLAEALGMKRGMTHEVE